MAKVVLLLLAVTPFLSLLPFLSLALNQDFCVADLPRGDTPAGYPCKPQAAVTADDFYYRGLGTTGPTINPFNIGLSSAFVTKFPGVNGLGISAARVDFRPRRRRAAALAPGRHRAPLRHRGLHVRRLHHLPDQQGVHQDAVQGGPHGVPAGPAALPVQPRQRHGGGALVQQRQPRPHDPRLRALRQQPAVGHCQQGHRPG